MADKTSPRQAYETSAWQTDKTSTGQQQQQ